MDRNRFKLLLEKGNLSVSDRMLDQFEQFRLFLLEKNQQMNLISQGDEAKVYERHFLDSVGMLRLSRFSQQARVVDLGSGAGFPGIPLKILRPDLAIDLVESRLKRAHFLSEAVALLGLEHVHVLGQRMEEASSELAGATIVVSRAVSQLINLAQWVRPVLRKSGGSLLVLKGGDLGEELKRLSRKKAAFGIGSVDIVDYYPFPEIKSEAGRKLVTITFERLQ